MASESFQIAMIENNVNSPMKEPPSQYRSRIAKQVVIVLGVSLAYVSLGASLTWPSPAISSLQEDNSTLVGTEIVLSSAEKDMTGSLVYLGSLFGAWFAGWMVNRFGRLISLRFLGLPFIIGWMFTGLAHDTSLLLTGRLIHGLGGGCLTIAGYAYIIELSDTAIRGMMATTPTLGIVLGNLYIVAIGYSLQWHYLSFVGAIPPVLFIIVTLFLPESPSFLIIKGKSQKAISLLKALRGEYVDVEAEVKALKQRNTSSTGGWKGLLDKQIIHRILVVVTTFLLSQACGNLVIMIYTARILQNTGAPMDPDAITAIAGLLRVGGTLGAIFLLDVLGRRYCLLISHALNAVCMIVLGSCVYLADQEAYSGPDWLPMVCVMTSLFVCEIGVHPIPFIISSEYFPTNVRAQASSVCFSVGTIIIFGSLQLYSPMLTLLTQAGLYWFYGCFSVLGSLFALFILIETKGKSVG